MCARNVKNRCLWTVFACVIALCSMGCENTPEGGLGDTSALADGTHVGDDTQTTSNPDVGHGGDTTVSLDTPCVPQCGGGRVCGDDGCGSACGECNSGFVCSDGACVSGSCAPGCTSGCEQGCYDFGDCTSAGSLGLLTHANVHTVGFVISGAAAATPGDVFYRKDGQALWRLGHPTLEIDGGDHAGSLFHLEPDTDYRLMVRYSDATSCALVRTLPQDPNHQTTSTIYVNAAAAPGGDGSAGAPFDTIQAGVDQARAGSDVVVAAGVYRESVQFPFAGDSERYIRVLGEPGAILDGSDASAQNPAWEADGASIYRLPWSRSPTYLNRDGLRQYHYLSLADLRSGTGDDGEAIDEGFVVDGGFLYVRSLTDPASHTWQLPELETAFFVDDTSWIWIEGFEIRYYGEGTFPKGIDIRSSSNVVVRNNHIYGTRSPVWSRKGSSYVRVEGNRIHQTNIPNWPWPAVKGTDHENTAINLGGGTGQIAADNLIYDIFNGIGTGSFGDASNTDIAYDADVYRNRMIRVTDDGLEPEGACINNRFWANTADDVHNGISLAPITVGPVWVMRNRFTNYTQSGFKVSNDSEGPVLLYHNTCYTTRPDHNGMNISGPFTGMTFRNNIIHGTKYTIEMSRAALPNDLDYDNLFTTRGAPVIKWDDQRYDTLADFCATTNLECNAQPDAPALLDPANFKFALSDSSPNIDAGVLIPGINDAFVGDAPDIGYLELGAEDPPPP